MTSKRQTVLFICTRNSARSIFSEAILRALAPDRFEVFSAGLNPDRVHPLTIQVLEEHGHSTEELHSKALADFLGKVAVTYAIIVCEQAAERCPTVYPFALEVLHWPFLDPAGSSGAAAGQLMSFRNVYQDIRNRIEHWLDVELADGGPLTIKGV